MFPGREQVNPDTSGVCVVKPRSSGRDRRRMLSPAPVGEQRREQRQGVAFNEVAVALVTGPVGSAHSGETVGPRNRLLQGRVSGATSTTLHTFDWRVPQVARCVFVEPFTD